MGSLRPTGFAGVLIAVALLHGLDPAVAQQSAACDELDGFHRLDFWVGEWDVVAGDERVGTNRIEKILDGCAILEHWRDNGGSEGKSLFYYNHATDTWRQVWVTQTATMPGGLKEKELIESLPGGAIRFQGTIPLPDGRSYLDRTTLTPERDGRVRQVIEISVDGGATWEVRFDAMYVPRGGSG